MPELNLTEEQLAMLLQASRDFAFEQIAQGMVLLPFATCVKPDGDMNFVRFAEPGTELSPDEVLALTEKEVAQEAGKGGLIAAAVVSGVRLNEPHEGMEDAVRVHVEAPGFARQFLAFYAMAEGGTKVAPGKLVPFEADAVIFSN